MNGPAFPHIVRDPYGVPPFRLHKSPRVFTSLHAASHSFLLPSLLPISAAVKVHRRIGNGDWAPWRAGTSRDGTTAGLMHKKVSTCTARYALCKGGDFHLRGTTLLAAKGNLSVCRGYPTRLLRRILKQFIIWRWSPAASTSSAQAMWKPAPGIRFNVLLAEETHTNFPYRFSAPAALCDVPLVSMFWSLHFSVICQLFRTWTEWYHLL